MNIRYSLLHTGCLILVSATAGPAIGAEPMALSSSYWKDPAFRKAFNGSYRIEARIEPAVSSGERGVLVAVQGLMAEGRRKEALEKLKGSALTAKSAALTFNLANLHFEEGEMEAAIKAYESAVKRHPSFRRAHRNLAMSLIREGKLDRGLPHLLEALRLGDAAGTTYGLLGYCRLQRQEWASALQAYRLAQVSEPEVADWKVGVAQCLQHLDARAEAAALMDEVIRQRPEEASYALLQAGVLLELGRPEQAVKALDLPRRLGSLDGNGLMLLADLELRAGRTATAGERIEEAFAGQSKADPERVLPVIALCVARREWETAAMLIGKASADPGPGDSVALRRLQARLLIESEEDPGKGAAILREILETNPTDGRALLSLGKHEVSSGRVEAGELLLERATAADEMAAAPWVELARLRVDARRYGAALEAVDRALELSPGGELDAYRESLRRLVEAAR